MSGSPPTKIACPSCGADLAVPPYGKILKCEYCGYKSTLPSGPPAGASGDGAGSKVTMVVVPEGRRWGGDYRLHALIGMGVGAIVMILVFAWLLSYSAEKRPNPFPGRGGAPWRHGHEPGAALPGHSSARQGLVSPSPLALDVDGDGTDDLVTLWRSKGSEGGGVRVVALDGKTFKVRWRGDEIGRESGATGPRLFRDTNQLLLAASSVLVALRPTSGERRWSATLPDRVERIARRGTTLLVTTINGKETAFEAGSGTVTTSQASEGEDDDDDPQGLDADGEPASSGAHSLIDLTSSAFGGLRVHQSYCPPGRLERLRQGAPQTGARSQGGSRGRYALHGTDIVRRGRGAYRDGSRARPDGRSRSQTVRCDAEIGVAHAVQTEGSPVSFLVGYDREDTSEKWRLRLSPADSVIRLVRPPLVAFQGDFVVAGFMYETRTLILRLVNVESGREVWNASATLPSGHQLLGLGLGRTRAFAHTGARIFVFDAKTGKPTHEGDAP